jgi:hypothetical protein
VFVSLREAVSAATQIGLIGNRSDLTIDLTIEVPVLCPAVRAVGMWGFEVAGEKSECF